MNHFLLALLVVVGCVIAWGWLTEHLTLRRGGAESQRPHVYLGLVSAVVFKVLLFCANYRLASTALSRILSKEKMSGDVILDVIFRGSRVHINHVFGLLLIMASFFTLERLVTAIARLLGTDPADTLEADPPRWLMARRILSVFGWAALSVVVLYVDTSVLMVRMATLVWSSQYSGQISGIPDLPSLLRQHPNTLAAWMIFWLGVFYPVVILLSVITFRRAWLRFQAFLEAIRTERAAATVGGAVGVPGFAAPAAPPVILIPGAMGAPPPVHAHAAMGHAAGLAGGVGPVVGGTVAAGPVLAAAAGPLPVAVPPPVAGPVPVAPPAFTGLGGFAPALPLLGPFPPAGLLAHPGGPAPWVRSIPLNPGPV